MKEKRYMTNKEYAEKLSQLKEQLDFLTNELWKQKEIRCNHFSKAILQSRIVDDMFSFNEGLLNIQLEK